MTTIEHDTLTTTTRTATRSGIDGRARSDLTVWVDVCGLDDLVPDRGACALVGPYQVAVFRLSDGGLYAVSNYDPFSGAYVISRGLVGSAGDVPKVASPVFKQSFDLRTGACLDDDGVALGTFDVRLNDGRIEVALP
ncbi:MAG TPA: nitrite reductase small subunit NirD [Acidimicrobiales bacterium]|nr:nitrite reductase small subunit NirD [Acidimicrobiales bacterium]